MATKQATFQELKQAGLDEIDPEIARLIGDELERQRGQIELIASENFTWPAVLEAIGSVPTNKYAEGYPGRRYYGGCEVIDEIEQLAIDRAKELFGAEHANVQPHAGAQTNMAVYGAAMEPGDTLMALRLDQGGHLTHGHKVNFSGHLDDAQDARRASRRLHPLPRGAREGPRLRRDAGDAGRAARAHDRGEGDLLPHRDDGGLSRVPGTHPRQRRRARRDADRGRTLARHGRHGHAPSPRRPARIGLDG